MAKCKVMHVGRQNKKHRYRMGDVWLAETVEERDLGVWIGSDLKPVQSLQYRPWNMFRRDEIWRLSTICRLRPDEI